MKKISARLWISFVLIGLMGQFAWTIENMYFNVFLYQTISTDPRYIADMVAWSAASATLTTLLMGALSDRIGKRKALVVGGYLLWGLATAAFGLVTVENTCPADGGTRREEIKQLLQTLEKDYPGLRTKIFGAIRRYPLYGWDTETLQR